MAIVVLDLEWNGAFCKKLGGYFNEIIEIGAVRLDENLKIADRFDAVIRPVVSRKLTHWVTDLTGYTDEQVRAGIPFAEAMKRLHRFIGDQGATLLTWSTTDLTVFMENCRYHYGNEQIPFVSKYMDLQAYAQRRMELDMSQQVGLAKFAELLGMDSASLELHHAIDDSVLSAQIFRRVYEKSSFKNAVVKTDDDFYQRINFKPSFIRELDDPAVKQKEFRFRCNDCGKRLKTTADWQFRHRYFTAPLQCACGKKYVGRVQIRRLYDGPEVKRRLLPVTPKQTEEPYKNPPQPSAGADFVLAQMQIVEFFKN